MTRMLISPLVVLCPLLAAALIVLAVLSGPAVYQPRVFATEMTETERCQFPCWRGIRPGRTELVPVHEFLVTAGYHAENPSGSVGSSGVYYGKSSPERCSVRLLFKNTRVSSIRLTQCPGMTLGHLMVELGEPQTAYLFGSKLTFRDGIITAELDEDCRERLTPETPVLSLTLSLPREADSDQFPWSGFKHNRYYTPDSANYRRVMRCLR